MGTGEWCKMTDVELIEAVKNHQDRAVTAGELSEQFDMTRQGILSRLNELNDRGVITKKTVGAKAVVWWVSDNHTDEISSLPSSSSQ